MDYIFRQESKDISYIYGLFKEKRIIVDRDYQRRSVWMERDKVRLIETILAGYVMPEVYFWVATRDQESGEAITHIVDGQQRISAIASFINNEYKLSEKYFTIERLKEKYSNKLFVELDPEDKNKIWEYPISVVNIDSKCTREQIKEMFFRLNMTEYSLNDQERLKSKGGAFCEAGESLSYSDFWSEVKVFSAKDVKRMLDVQYCENIYILANEGITDNSQTKINSYAKDYFSEFDSDETLLKRIEGAMKRILEIKTEITTSFISKKLQLYTLFALMLKFERMNQEVTEDFKGKFEMFVSAYDKFRNGYDISFEEDAEMEKLYSEIKRYKLASSEGVNRLGNRVIRLETLEKICQSSDSKTFERLQKLSLVLAEYLERMNIEKSDEEGQDEED